MTLLQALEKKNIEKSQLLPEQWEWINELKVARKGNLYKKKKLTLGIINYWGSALLYLRNLQTRKRAAAVSK